MISFDVYRNIFERKGDDFTLFRIGWIAILFTIFNTVIFMGCDPGYNCDYYLENDTKDTIAYKLYWRSHDLYKKTGKIPNGKSLLIASNGGLGFARNEFLWRAESLYINDSIRINTCDTAMFVTNEETDPYGKYTLVLTDSLIAYHQKIRDSLESIGYDCYR